MLIYKYEIVYVYINSMQQIESEIIIVRRKSFLLMAVF